MIQWWRRRQIAVLLSVLLLAACASTPTNRSEILGSWKADNYDNKLSSFLVISLSDDEPAIREKVESIMASRLRQEGLHAVASSDIMPVGEKVDRETVRAAMAGKDFDGVLVSRLLSVERGAVYVPPSPDITFANSFSRHTPIVATPGRVEHSSAITMQLDLYDTTSQHLIWSLRTQTVNPDNVTDAVQDEAGAAVKDLRSKGLI
ncbi:MAG: hypothetical protein P8164_05785 [Gammaproteobacteria bacterium]|jgi:hypothetical protein